MLSWYIYLCQRGCVSWLSLLICQQDYWRKLCIFMALMALFVILPCYCSLVACVFAAWCYAYAQPMLSCGVCLSGCLSRSWNLSKQINISSKFFSPSGSHTVLIFSISNVTEILRWEPPNGGIECRWRRQKSPFTTNIWPHHVLWTVRLSSSIHAAAPDRGKLMTLVAVKLHCLFSTGDDNEVFMTRSLNVILKTSKQHLVVCSGKSEAEVTNSKRPCSRYCSVEANYRQTADVKHRASSLRH